MEDFQTLRQELKLYDPNLAAKPWAVIANKVDLPEAKENLKRLKAKVRKVKIIPMSAQEGEGIDELRKLLEELASSPAV